VLAQRSDRDFGRAGFLAGLLAEHADHLGGPCTRHLGGKVRERRFELFTRAGQGHRPAGPGAGMYLERAKGLSVR